MGKYTIQDLADGNVVLEYDINSLGLLIGILKKAFPADTSSIAGDGKYYCASKYMKGKWTAASREYASHGNIQKIGDFEDYKVVSLDLNKETFSISRTQMKEIYDIACASWKTKIENLTTRYFSPFVNNSELPLSIVKEMFEASDDIQKDVLKTIFPDYGKMVIPKGELAWVRDYDDMIWNVRYSAGDGNFYHGQEKCGETDSWNEVLPFNVNPFKN